jgi:hypothetical protein
MKTLEDMKTFKNLRHQPEHETGLSPAPSGLGPVREAPSSRGEEVQLDTLQGVNKGFHGSSPLPDGPNQKIQEAEESGHLFIWRTDQECPSTQVEGFNHGS